MIVTQGYFELFYRLQKGLPAFQSAAGWPSLGKNPHQAGAAVALPAPGPPGSLETSGWLELSDSGAKPHPPF